MIKIANENVGQLQFHYPGRKDTKMLMTFLSQDLAGFVFTLGCSFVPMRGPEGPSLISR
jgi:hypothetical protein